MDPELKQKWITALRSGKYEQCKGTLRKRDSYCCLGVLCDVAGAKWRPADVDDRSWHRPTIGDVVGGNVDFLDSQLRALFRLDDNEQRKLATMNDSGKSFAELADVIDGTKWMGNNALLPRSGCAESHYLPSFVLPRDVQRRFSRENDVGATFEQIADIIEHDLVVVP